MGSGGVLQRPASSTPPSPESGGKPIKNVARRQPRVHVRNVSRHRGFVTADSEQAHGYIRIQKSRSERTRILEFPNDG